MNRILAATAGTVFTATRIGLFGNQTIVLRDENSKTIPNRTLRYEGISVANMGVMDVGHYFDDDYIYAKSFDEKWVWSIRPLVIKHINVGGNVQLHDRTTEYASETA